MTKTESLLLLILFSIQRVHNERLKAVTHVRKQKKKNPENSTEVLSL